MPQSVLFTTVIPIVVFGLASWMTAGRLGIVSRRGIVLMTAVFALVLLVLDAYGF